MPILADPKTIAGPLSAADLEEAHAYSTGRIYRLHRIHCEPATVSDDEAEALYRQACAAEGGQHADPVPSGSALSMRRHRQTRTTVALALALAVVGYLVRTAWPLLGA